MKKSIFQHFSIDYFAEGLKKYAVFKGRARRAEYFSFNIISSVITNGAVIIFDLIFGEDSSLSAIGVLPTFVLLLPSLAIIWRRLHDCGKSGLYLFVPVYNIILTFRKGTPGENKYGPDPIPSYEYAG